ncbi:hypothetical protein BIW11_04993 [Tropilaelaps mercedesae]|uniref:Solute carrier family 13 member 5-like n=1 Tax=Tropilaelaps mercedesae TaxID=418985 RepID=A0A1V9WZ29_9ACAR|nr:hypothetical protein BIW11_04993 [Tropilaelaps mercedesae]
MASVARQLYRGWKRTFAFFVPLLLAVIPLMIPTKEAQCAYVVLLMSLFWMTEIIPLAVTAFMPLVFFPLFDILRGNAMGKAYFGETVSMFLGSLIAATAVEYSNLHNRIALRSLLLVGVTPKRLLAGIMAVTALLSMFISNAATAVLMVPIIEGILHQLRVEQPKSHSSKPNFDEADNTNIEMKRTSLISILLDELGELNNASSIQKDAGSRGSVTISAESLEQKAMLRRALYLGVCYAANIGGTGSLTGSPPNLVLKAFIDLHYPRYKNLTFTTWIFFGTPTVVINIALGWLFISFTYMKYITTDPDEAQQVWSSVRAKYAQLGSMSFHEGSVAFLFSTLLILWLFREPGFVAGWGALVPKSVKDSVPAFAIVLAMFLLPQDPSKWATSPALLDWKVIHEKTPWSVVFLIGGSIALSDGVQESGLSKWIGYQLDWLQNIPPGPVVLLVSITAMALTEVTSNTATCSVLLPIAKKVRVHPVLVELPVAFGSSYAFMLPVATAPNAIIIDGSGMTTGEMVSLINFYLLRKFVCTPERRTKSIHPSL